jgi:hypothetical protein
MPFVSSSTTLLSPYLSAQPQQQQPRKKGSDNVVVVRLAVVVVLAMIVTHSSRTFSFQLLSYPNTTMTPTTTTITYHHGGFEDDEDVVAAATSSSSWLHPDCQALNVTREAVAMSRTVGNIHRLQRAFFRNIKSTNRTTRIVVLGGSVTAGHDCYPAALKELWNLPNLTCAWPYQLEQLLSTRDNTISVEIINKAIGGTPSSAGLTQIMGLAAHDPAVDVIIIAWAANDDNYKKFYGSDPYQMQRSLETLIRTALALPSQPAVLIFEDFGLRHSYPVAEEMHNSVAHVYELPIISARAAFWNLYRHQIKSLSAPAHVPAIWHQRFACLIEANLWQDIRPSPSSLSTTLSATRLDMSTYQDPLVAVAQPVFGGTTLRCRPIHVFAAASETLQHAPSYVDPTWSYRADAPGKFGYLANTTNATLQFTFSLGSSQPAGPNNGTTTTTTDASDHHYQKYVLFVHYLRSYSPEWGQATLQVITTTTSSLLPQPKTVVQLDATTLAHESQTVEASVEWNRTVATLAGRDDDDDNPVVTATITVIRGKMKIVEVSLFGCEDGHDESS